MPVEVRGPRPHATSTGAAADVSACGAPQSGGGAIENTCSSVSAWSRGVDGSETNMAQPEEPIPVASRRAQAGNVGSEPMVCFMAGGRIYRTRARQENYPTWRIHSWFTSSGCYQFRL